MTLWEMLDTTYYFGKVMIYSRNAYDQCIGLFRGTVLDARRDEESVWDYLPAEVDQWICGNGAALIYVKHYDYENRLEKHYYDSDKWTKEHRPYRFTAEVDAAFEKWCEGTVSTDE